MQHKRLIVFLTGLILSFCAGSSVAQPQKQQIRGDAQKSVWSVSLGAIGLFTPDYEGSDDHKFQGFPIIDMAWRDIFFLHPRKGIGAYFLNRDDLKVAGSIGYAFGRDESDSDDLNGLGDIDGGATANLLIEWKVNDFAFDLDYARQITGADTGFQIHTGFGYRRRFGRQIIFSPSIKTTYASADYMEEYFGISRFQSSLSVLPVYDTDPGFKSAGVNVALIFILDRHWSVQTIATYNRLIGDAGDSPVVKDENQYFGRLGLSYKF